MTIDRATEWLEADGLGGFASGTTAGIRTRRYHALLCAATQPPAGRMVLVNGFEAWVETARGTVAVSSQQYLPDVIHPDGASRVRAFSCEPWPTWTYDLGDGATLVQEIFCVHGAPATVVFWRWQGGPARLVVRPLLSGRDFHALHHENGQLRFHAEVAGDRVGFAPYPGVPSIAMAASGAYEHAPDWYRSFLYEAERERGLDFREDLASPGRFHLDLTGGEAAWVAAAGELEAGEPALGLARRLRENERARRARFASPLDRAADQYVVARGAGRTLIAGYPWFGDWGRDTFIALRGLCLAGSRREVARDILVEWAGAVDRGMLPNRFPDRGEPPEYNSVDAALWFCVAVEEYLRGGEDPARARLEAAVDAIVAGFAAGTRHGIRADDDGLLAAGEPGWQLTWMDAKVGDRVITPRVGKPVEVQALWIHAMAAAGRRDPRWAALGERASTCFARRFWNAERGCLYDVVDVDHVLGAVDRSLRPNQIFAVGGLPRALLSGERARAIVDMVERTLWTPLGLRSLAPGEPGYVPHYGGGVAERDGAYHQGTVWPWLAGPFVEAWLRVRGGTAEARAEARKRFLAPLLAHLEEAGLGHVSEIADAEPPHAPRGCPFQAWSVGELIRLDRVVLRS